MVNIHYKKLRLFLLMKLAKFSKKMQNKLFDEFESKSLCILPWIHSHYSPSGKASLCCLSAKSRFGELDKESFEEMWNNSRHRAVRKLMMLERQPNACQVCYKNESIYQSSFRKEINEKFKDSFTRILETNPFTGFFKAKPWLYMDIRFSNLCNFKCRTCDPVHSHLWAADVSHEYNQGKPKLIDIFEKKYFPRMQIENSLSAVEEIYFAGGEPLILDEHYRMLSRMIESGNAKNVRLSYSTNLSVINYKKYELIQLWENFKSVQLVVSIDGYGDLGEFIRHGLKWDHLQKNVELLKKSTKKVTICVAITVSALNIEKLDEMILKMIIQEKWFSGDGVLLNILTTPPHYNIQVLPLPVKDEIKSKLYALISQNKSYFKKEMALEMQINKVISFLMYEDKSALIPRFIEDTKFLDFKRNQKSTEHIKWIQAFYK